jgi:uncharacterized integral membrane protein
MKTFRLIVILTLSLVIALAVAQNTAQFQAHFLWFTIEMPAILLLFLTAVGGFVLGLLVALFMREGAQSKL